MIPGPARSVSAAPAAATGGASGYASGPAASDALMGNNSPYLGSDHAGVPCVKVSGTAHTINLT